MKLFNKFIREHYLVIICVLMYLFFIGNKLIHSSSPFFDWDESIYIQISKEMITKSSFIPTFNENIWLEKPPLSMLVYSLCFLLPFQIEISARIISLLLTCAILMMFYVFTFKITKNSLISTLGVLLLSYNSIFLQRAHVVSTDTFLLIGWLGYFLYYKNYKLSTLFLLIGTLSKSLLGLYPLVILHLYYGFLRLCKRLSEQELLEYKQFINATKLQLLISSLWFIIMALLYKKKFFDVMFYDHILKRVTYSVESHFGQRTFYLDLLFHEYGILLFIVALFSLIYILYAWYKKTISNEKLLLWLCGAPFLFALNLVKTKISWYVYPALYAYILLIIYPITKIYPEKIKNSFAVICILSSLYIFYNQQVLSKEYSKLEPHQILAKQAKILCKNLLVLEDNNTRKTYNELDAMHLTLSTTKDYGSRPSIVYYYGSKILISYSKDDIAKYKDQYCILLNKEDIDNAISSKVLMEGGLALVLPN